MLTKRLSGDNQQVCSLQCADMQCRRCDASPLSGNLRRSGSFRSKACYGVTLRRVGGFGASRALPAGDSGSGSGLPNQRESLPIALIAPVVLRP
jgi:hypothetical protein